MKHTYQILAAAAALAIFGGCKQQTGGSTSNVAADVKKEIIAHDKAILAHADVLKDPYTTLYTINSLLAYDTGNLKYIDTAAQLYGKLGLGEQAMTCAQKVLAKEPNNVTMMEIQAGGYMALGNMDKAADICSKLYDKTNKPKYLFNLAMLQIQMHAKERNFSEAERTISKIENHPDYMKDSAAVQTDAGGQMQKVPLNACTIYLRGVIDGQNQKYEGAIKKFESALKIDPDFYLANKNYNYLAQAVQQAQAQAQQQQGHKQ